MTNSCHATDGCMLPITNGCIKTVRCNHFCNRKAVCIRGLHYEDNPGLHCIRGLHCEDNRGLLCIRGLQFSATGGCIASGGCIVRTTEGCIASGGCIVRTTEGCFASGGCIARTTEGCIASGGCIQRTTRGCFASMGCNSAQPGVVLHPGVARQAYEAYEAYEVRFHAVFAESGNASLPDSCFFVRFALGENGVTGVTMGFHPIPRLGTSPQTPSPLRGGLKPQNKKDPPQLSRSDSVVKGQGNSVPLRGSGQRPDVTPPVTPRLNLPLSRLPDGSKPFARTSADRQEFGCRPPSRRRSDSGQTRSLHRWKSLRR